MLKDKITISWHIDDVKYIYEKEKDYGNIDVNLSDDDFREILDIIDKNHNAEIGINWVVIETTLHDYIADKFNS